jgi:hypothetical protein
MLLLCAFGSVEPKRGISEFCCKLVCDGVVDSNHTLYHVHLFGAPSGNRLESAVAFTIPRQTMSSGTTSTKGTIRLRLDKQRL